MAHSISVFQCPSPPLSRSSIESEERERPNERGNECCATRNDNRTCMVGRSAGRAQSREHSFYCGAATARAPPRRRSRRGCALVNTVRLRRRRRRRRLEHEEEARPSPAPPLRASLTSLLSPPASVLLAVRVRAPVPAPSRHWATVHSNERKRRRRRPGDDERGRGGEEQPVSPHEGRTPSVTAEHAGRSPPASPPVLHRS